MTQKEFNEAANRFKADEWLKTKSIIIKLPVINYSKEFKGITSLFVFVNQQLRGWEKYLSLPGELENSKNYFGSIKNNLEHFINTANNIEDPNQIENHWRIVQNQIDQSNNFQMTYDSAEAKFLSDLNNNHQKYFRGAWMYISNQIRNDIANNRDSLTGALIGYEFSLQSESQVFNRRKKESSGLTSLKSDFLEYINTSEKEVSERIEKGEERFNESIESLNLSKLEREKNFDEWFIKSKDQFNEFDSQSKSKITSLEETFKIKLQLAEPAEYWSERGNKLRKQGWWAFTFLILFVGITVWSLSELLWRVPEQIYSSFFDGDKSAAIRWSIIYITMISFIAFSIRAIAKVMFSSFHLARDSEERYSLTYFYLALLQDSKVDPEDRKMIMQSLFSRAETGLLKDDASPTMPNDVVGKYFGGR